MTYCSLDSFMLLLMLDWEFWRFHMGDLIYLIETCMKLPLRLLGILLEWGLDGFLLFLRV